MKQAFKTAVLIAAVLLAVAGCTSENELGTGADSGEASINIGTRSALYPNDPDRKTVSLRIMAFSSGRAVSNVFYGESQLADLIVHRMKAGKNYTFVFIVNEYASAADNAVKASLDAVTTFAQLADMKFASSMFADARPVPMVYMKREVDVLTTNKAVVDGTELSQWTVEPVRLAVRFDLVIKSEEDISTAFRGVRFERFPDEVPILPEAAADIVTRNTTRTYLLTDANAGEHFEGMLAAELGSYGWGMKVKRLIVPSNYFTPVSQSGKASMLRVLQTTSDDLHTTLGVNEGNSDYTLPRNTHFNFTGLIERGTSELDVNMVAVPWGDVEVEGDIKGRAMSLSKASVRVSIGNPVTIDFWTNQKEVEIEAKCQKYNDATSEWREYDIDLYFTGLVGDDPINYQFNPATGVGSIVVEPSLSSASIAGVYKITLNATGLKKEILVNIVGTGSVSLLFTDHLPGWDQMPFVQAFWRNDQVGERVIYGLHQNTSTWRATIEYPAGATGNLADFVVISPTVSPDPNFKTDDPGNAELYQLPVEDWGVESLPGRGAVFFRLGLKSTNPNSFPRYARVRVDYDNGNKTSYVYIRQGEAADYVFRPGDYGVARTSARRFSPYNLTDPAGGAGGAAVANHNIVGIRQSESTYDGRKFVDFPSKVGYTFKFNDSRAYHITNPGYDVSAEKPITGWSVSYASVWSNLLEICPEGYRHPSHHATPTNSTSEMYQSLYRDPSASFEAYTRVGMCADGYYDRHRIVQGNANHDGTSYVGDGKDVAAIGLIVPNQLSHASIFLPFGGARAEGDGHRIAKPGTASLYWTNTTTSSPAGHAYALNVVNLWGHGSNAMQTTSRAASCVVRCVAE